jgi:ABC-type nickel/cobalt efflux system permease component RcnA
MRTAAVAAALLVLAGPLSAHPIPSDNHDRAIIVRVTADAVEVDYRLEMDETRAALDLPWTETAGIGSRRQLHETVLRFNRPVLAENLDATLDGKPLDFTCVSGAYQLTDHLRCDYRFRAVWHPAPGESHAFTFREGNYHDDNLSAVRLALAASGRVVLLRSVAPDERLMALPASDRKPGDGERLRKAGATFRLTDEEPHAIAKPALPPDPEPSRDGPGIGPAVRVRLPPAEAVARYKPDAEEAPDRAEDDATPRTLVHLLLDTRRGFAVLMLLAAGLGAAHALTPGHGKTLAAAYLVGERGTVWHALFLGLVTTLTHTAAVFFLALALPVFFPDVVRSSVQSALELFGGLLVTGLGLWLLMVRLAGRADHVHIGGGHHHHPHGGGRVHQAPDIRPGWRGLVILGVSGGIVPCWDAIAIVGGTVSAQRLWLGPPLLLAFSAGLASVLVAVGVAVVQARKWAGSRWGTPERFRGLERALPLISAVVVTGMGLLLCFESIHPGGR